MPERTYYQKFECQQQGCWTEFVLVCPDDHGMDALKPSCPKCKGKAERKGLQFAYPEWDNVNKAAGQLLDKWNEVVNDMMIKLMLPADQMDIKEVVRDSYKSAIDDMWSIMHEIDWVRTQILDKFLGEGVGQWHVLSTEWDCPESPFGYCAYHIFEDRAHDDCIFCHEPQERKQVIN